MNLARESEGPNLTDWRYLYLGEISTAIKHGFMSSLTSGCVCDTLAHIGTSSNDESISWDEQRAGTQNQPSTSKDVAFMHDVMLVAV